MTKSTSVKASQIAKFLKTKLFGKDIIVKKPVPIYDLSANCLAFIREKSFEESLINIIDKNPASLIICPLQLKDRIKSSFILSSQSYLDFSRIVKKFFDCPKPKIIIGKNCHIEPTAVIGEDGYSYVRDEKGVNQHITCIGGVKIGDNVDIGAGATITRGILSDTCIGSNVKIDNLVHVAHNCVIGEGTQLAAGVILGGGVIIGKNCLIGLNASIRQRIKIGDNAMVGMGAIVVKDVPSGITVVGNPARPLIKKEK